MKPTSILSALVLVLAYTYASTPSARNSRRALTARAGPPAAAAQRPQVGVGSVPRPQAQVQRPGAAPLNGPAGVPNPNAASQPKPPAGAPNGRLAAPPTVNAGQLPRPLAGAPNGRPAAPPNVNAGQLPRPLAAAPPNGLPAAPLNGNAAPLPKPLAAPPPNGRPAAPPAANGAPQQPPKQGVAASTSPNAMSPLRSMPNFPAPSCGVAGQLGKRDCPIEFGNVGYCGVVRCSSSGWAGWKVKRAFPGQVAGQCYTCGTHAYADTAVEAAATEAHRLLNAVLQVYFWSTTRRVLVGYPQEFRNRVGMGSTAQVIVGLPAALNGRNGSTTYVYEFPILRSGLLYTGTTHPGPDRVVLVYQYTAPTWVLLSVHVMTHTGQAGNAFGYVQPV